MGRGGSMGGKRATDRNEQKTTRTEKNKNRKQQEQKRTKRTKRGEYKFPQTIIYCLTVVFKSTYLGCVK